MSYTAALTQLRPGISGWKIMDDSSPEKLLETIANWPLDIPLPTITELKTAYSIIIASAEKKRFNDIVKAEIAALDSKRIRPLAEGDLAYLAKLNEQIATLRAKLK